MMKKQKKRKNENQTAKKNTKKRQQQFQNEDWKVNKLTRIVNNTKHNSANSEMESQALCAITLALVCNPLWIMIYITLDTRCNIYESDEKFKRYEQQATIQIQT